MTLFRHNIHRDMIGHVLANAGGTQIACGNNTKGTAVNIGGASPGYIPCFDLHITHADWSAGSAWGNFMIDVMQGSDVIVADFARSVWGGTDSEYWASSIFCPIPLQDEQISIRGACEQDTKDIYAYIIPYYDHPAAELNLQRSTTYGVVANQQGKPITAGSSAAGTWTSIDASTSNPIKALGIVCNFDADSSQINFRGQIQLGINVSGTVYPITDKKAFTIFASNNAFVIPTEFGFDIPTGADLQARITGSSAATVLVTVHTFF